MLSVRGIYENGHIRLMESVPEKKRFKVIVTILEELKENENNSPEQYVGSLKGAGITVGDLTEPIDHEWEID